MTGLTKLIENINEALSMLLQLSLDLPPLKKKFYTEARSVSMLTAEEVSEWR